MQLFWTVVEFGISPIALPILVPASTSRVLAPRIGGRARLSKIGIKHILAREKVQPTLRDNFQVRTSMGSSLSGT